MWFGALVIAAATAAHPAHGRLIVTSTDLHAGRTVSMDQVFNNMGCTGANRSPQVAWRGAPTGTKSFAVTLYDPDAPTGSGWWHWVVYDVPASATQLATGAGDPAGAGLPNGSMQGSTDFGAPGYGGPCPPPGDKPHHYILTVYALDVDKIDVPAQATAAMVGFNIHAHTLAKGSITALYKR